jgi:hypothetical protein
MAKRNLKQEEHAERRQSAAEETGCEGAEISAESEKRLRRRSAAKRGLSTNDRRKKYLVRHICNLRKKPAAKKKCEAAAVLSQTEITP